MNRGLALTTIALVTALTASACTLEGPTFRAGIDEYTPLVWFDPQLTTNSFRLSFGAEILHIARGEGAIHEPLIDMQGEFNW